MATQTSSSTETQTQVHIPVVEEKAKLSINEFLPKPGHPPATFRVIQALDNYESSTSIASFGGWKKIVPRNKFKVGEMVVFLEPDSLVPVGFLEKDQTKTIPVSYRGNPYFLLTRNHVRWRQTTSNFLDAGKILKVKEVPAAHELVLKTMAYFPDYKTDKLEAHQLASSLLQKDLSSLLGVEFLDEVPNDPEETVLGPIPDFLPSWQKDRLNNISEILISSPPPEFYAHHILPGLPFILYNHKGKIGFCSKFNEINLEVKSFYSDFFESRRFSSAIPVDVAFYGYICGPNILDNPFELSSKDFWITKSVDLKHGRFYSYPDTDNIIRNVNANILTSRDVRQLKTQNNLFGNPTKFANLDQVLNARGNYEGHIRSGNMSSYAAMDYLPARDLVTSGLVYYSSEGLTSFETLSTKDYYLKLPPQVKRL